MNSVLSKTAVAGLVVVALFWETLSVFASYGEFSNFHFDANSERFLLIAPFFILLWLGRHLLPAKLRQKMRSKQSD